MKITTKTIVIAVAFVLALAMVAAPASAVRNGLNDTGIASGDTIFIYEQVNLSAFKHDVNRVVTLYQFVDQFGGQIKHTIVVNDYATFDVLPAVVNGYYGTYYDAASNTSTTYGTVPTNYTNIAAPSVTLDVVLNNSVHQSINGGSITRDNGFQFKVTNNIAGAINTASNYVGPVWNIEITTPGGGVTTLFGDLDQNHKVNNRGFVNLSKYYFVNNISAAQLYVPTGNGAGGTGAVAPTFNLRNAEAGEYSATLKWPSAFTVQYGTSGTAIGASTYGLGTNDALHTGVNATIQANTGQASTEKYGMYNMTAWYDQGLNSNAVTWTILSKTVSVTANAESVVRGNPFVLTVTGRSDYQYAFFIKEASMDLDKYPYMNAGQPGTRLMTNYANFQLDVGWRTFATELPTNGQTGAALAYATEACGNLTTKADGTRAIQFETNSSAAGTAGNRCPTDARDYTIKVFDPTDTNKYDTVKVTVEKGAVTIAYEGTGTYYIGQEVKLSGTNTDSKTTYLFMSGPNLQANGVMLTNTQTAAADGNAATFDSRDVETDDTWAFKWDTSSITGRPDSGTYTLYAVSTTNNKASLSGKKYATAAVILKKPFVNAQASASTLAKGDKLYITGTAEGDPTTVKVWVFGVNYRNLYNSQSVGSDGSFSYELDRGDTENLSPGQYFCVVQHPMQDGRFGVVGAPIGWTDSGVGTRWINTTYEGLATQLTTDIQELQASDAANVLIDYLNNPNTDDTYRKLTFMVEDGWIRIDPIGDQYVGETFEITGTTNLAEGDQMLVDIKSSAFQPTDKTQSGEFSGTSGTIEVQKGDGYNTWTFTVDASSFKPDEYTVKVESIDISNKEANALFNVVEKGAATTAPSTPATTAPATPATPTTPGFGALVAVAGLGAVAALVLRRE